MIYRGNINGVYTVKWIWLESVKHRRTRYLWCQAMHIEMNGLIGGLRRDAKMVGGIMVCAALKRVTEIGRSFISVITFLNC